MNSRERVLAVLSGEMPDRVPCWCGASDEFWAKAKRYTGILEDEDLRIRMRDDFRRVYAAYNGPDLGNPQHGKIRTIFGIERDGLGYGQALNHPLAGAGLSDVLDYPWPDPAWMDVSAIEATARSYDGKYAILGGDWSPFWHDVMELFGMETFFIRMYTEPEVVKAALQKVVDYYWEVSRRIFDAAARHIDIFFIGNDFGSQCGPLLGPDLFREFIVPHLQRLVALGHDFGLKVQLHCCGGFAPLIPLMLETGLDALQAVQPSCQGMDLQTLKEQFGNRIVFNGAIDSHHVLIDGSAEEVRQKTREVLDIMMPGGRYIAGASHDSILEETPVENILAMFDTVVESGVYELINRGTA